MKVKVSLPSDEPDKTVFKIPSEGTHQLQIVDIIEDKNSNLNVLAKLEVSSGDDLGRTMLHRISLDSSWKGFFTTRLFLKAIGLEYKGDIDIDTDMFIGKTFSASIIHNTGKNGKTYANIDTYEFDAVTPVGNPDGATTPEMVKWEE